VQAGVFALIVVDVDFDFFGQVELGAVGKFQVFGIGGKNVVGFAGRNVLSEFPGVVGVLVPTNFFRLIGGAPDFYVNAVDGAIVRSPDCAEDYGVRLPWFLRRGIQDSRSQSKQTETEQ
jgi:hypothetical protein